MGIYEQPEGDTSPLWMSSKLSRKDIEDHNDDWNSKRDKTKWTSPARQSQRGYAKPFSRNDKGRKIGFRK